MATVKTIIRKNKLNREGLAPIYLQYCYQTKTVLISTGERIDPSDWNDQKGKPRKLKNREDLVQLGAFVRQQESRIEEIIREARLQGVEPTLDLVKEVYKGKQQSVAPISTEKVKTLWDWWEVKYSPKTGQ